MHFLHCFLSEVKLLINPLRVQIDVQRNPYHKTQSEQPQTYIKPTLLPLWVLHDWKEWPNNIVLTKQIREYPQMISKHKANQINEQSNNNNANQHN